MGFESPGLALVTRYYWFLPAIAVALAGLFPGAASFGFLGERFEALLGVALTILAQPLFAWGAWLALRQRSGGGPGRLSLFARVFAACAVLALVAIGVPLLLRESLGEGIFLGLFGLGAAVTALILLKYWPLLALPWCLPAANLSGAASPGLGALWREARELVASDMERVIEGLPAVAALLAVTVLPIVLPLLGVSGEGSVATYVWIGLVVLLAPWAHVHFQHLTLGALTAEAGSTPAEHAAEADRPDDESTAAVSAVAAAGRGALTDLRDIADGSMDLDAMVDGRTPLIAAVTAPQERRQEQIRWLLEQGATPDVVDKRGRTALHHAASADDAVSIATLVAASAGVDVLDLERMSPLAVACEAGSWDAARALLAAGADPHGADGVLPLHVAAMVDGDDPSGVQLLVEAGESFDARGKLGRTPLMGAALKGNALVSSALLEAGASADAQDDFGNTALMEAARAGANAVLERLVFWKPNTEFRDKPGRTALLVAVSSRRADADTVRLLLAMGADRDVENRDGRRAGELAAAGGRWQMARALGHLVRTGQHEQLPVAAPDPVSDGPRIIDLQLFETAADTEWAVRRIQDRSRTELEAATVVMPAVVADEATAASVGADASESADADDHAADLDAIVDIQLDANSLDALAEHGTDVAAEGPSVDATPTNLSLPLPLPPVDGVGAEDRTDDGPDRPAASSTEPESPETDVAGDQPEPAKVSQSALSTLREAALEEDIERMRLVLHEEEGLADVGMTEAFLASMSAGRGIAPRWLLEHGLAANARDAEGRSLLSAALRMTPPNVEIIELLLEHGADCADEPEAALVLARDLVGQGADDVDEDRLLALLPGLVEQGAEVAATDVLGRTALHWAAKQHSAPLVAMLLDLGAEVDAQDRIGNSPLMHAVADRRAGVARVLLQHDADPRLTNEKGHSPLASAMADQDQTLARMLMGAAAAKGAEPEEASDREAELLAAAEGGNLGRVKRLLGAGVGFDIRDAKGCTPLLRAAGAGHATVVDALLGAGADPSIGADNGTTPLGAAVLGAHQQLVKLLCDRGIDPDQRQANGLTPLMLAAARWYPRIVSILLRSEADANARDDAGTTPLMAAALNSAGGDDADAGVATVKFLLRAGADVDAVNESGQTALMLLLGAGDGVPARDDDEDTPQRLAGSLVEAGTGLDLQDASGRSALHAAAAHGHHAVARLLVASGANRRLRDVDGLSPVDLAMERSDEELVDLFIRS